jgi:UDP-N-acetylmuramate--alanine ligase
MAKNIHIIGIGGIGTSSLAQIFSERGNVISGSDNKKSDITEELEKNKIKVFYNQKKENINKNLDLVIFSPAIPENNEELKEAKKLGIKTLSYPEALGGFSKDFFTIAVAGTHGKSTTTAMLAVIAKNAGLDPTVVVGTKVKEFAEQNFLSGNSKLLIIEACEYKRSFLNFHPDILIITNTELDHLDYYKNEADYLSAFETLENQSKKIIKNIEVEKRYKLKSPGDFNQENANNAALAAKELKISDEEIKNSLENFQGIWRRMEKKETKFENTIFIDDYAHHPTEIKVTLDAIREKNPDSKILCVFQPHQYSRTAMLLDKFANSFFSADKVIIPNIYQVRDSEEDLKRVSVDKLIDAIKNTEAKNGKSLKETAEYIRNYHQEYDIVVTMGAGDITSIYDLF